jgi:hypothetical protein
MEEKAQSSEFIKQKKVHEVHIVAELFSRTINRVKLGEMVLFDA